jgi:hypothetical protein
MSRSDCRACASPSTPLRAIVHANELAVARASWRSSSTALSAVANGGSSASAASPISSSLVVVPAIERIGADVGVR